jgi:hypothetical protein
VPDIWPSDRRVTLSDNAAGAIRAAMGWAANRIRVPVDAEVGALPLQKLKDSILQPGFTGSDEHQLIHCRRCDGIRLDDYNSDDADDDDPG